MTRERKWRRQTANWMRHWCRPAAFAASDRHVLHAEYERKPDLISLYLDDGIRVSIPRMKLQGLQEADRAKLAKIELLGRGTGLHWPLLDVDHYVPGLLHRVFGTSRWMAEIGHSWRFGHDESKSGSSPRQWQEGRTAKEACGINDVGTGTLRRHAPPPNPVLVGGKDCGNSLYPILLETNHRLEASSVLSATLSRR